MDHINELCKCNNQTNYIFRCRYDFYYLEELLRKLTTRIDQVRQWDLKFENYYKNARDSAMYFIYKSSNNSFFKYIVKQQATTVKSTSCRGNFYWRRKIKIGNFIKGFETDI